MAVSLRSQDGKRITNSPNAAAKNSDIYSGIFPGILPENIVGEHNPPCHLPLPAKTL